MDMHEHPKSLLVDKDGKETRLNYIEARKRIYVKEYCRLVRKLPEYKELQELYAAKKTLVLCEVDVPDKAIMSLGLLNELLDNEKIRFGHGLCLAKALLEDSENING